jgi:transposase
MKLKMSKQMKKYNSDFKLKCVTKYLSEKLTVSQICSEYNISKATIHKWVKQFKDNSSLIFNNPSISTNCKIKKLEEKEKTELYSKIGQLTIERDFLKKALDS